MELRDAASGRFVRWEPVSYEFPNILDDEFDSNWLIIRARARSDEEEWAFQGPWLLVREAQEFGIWMRQAATGVVPLPTLDDHGRTRPAVETIEPNLGLGLVSYTPDIVTIRVFLWLESAPPSTWNGRIKTDMDFFIDIAMTPADLERAADDWTAELAKFPQRA